MSEFWAQVGLIAAIASTVFVIFLLQSPSSQKRHDIRVGVLPDVAESALHKRYSNLLDHLSQETGLKLQLVTPNSYQHLLRLFADREIEMAYFGGLTFVRSQSFYDARPLVMRQIDTQFTSYFVVRANGPLQDCDDLSCETLAGKVLSFGSKLSTSGHLMPRHFLKTVLEIDPETYFGMVRYSGAHDQTALMVRDGEADIGVLNSEIFRSMQKEGRLKK